MVERPFGFAASAVALPGFYTQASQWLNAAQIAVVAPNPDTLVLLVANTPEAENTFTELLKEPYEGALDFDPIAFLLTESGIKRFTLGSTP